MFVAQDGVARLGVAPTGSDTLVDLSQVWDADREGGAAPTTVVELLERGADGLAAVNRALEASREGGTLEAAGQALASARLQAPIPRPGKILCVGRNYWEHAQENIDGWAAKGVDYKMPPWPKAFVKTASCVVGPDDDIVHPAFSEGLDYEIEFAIVIGKLAHYVSEDQAMDYVAGYTIVNDVTARDVQHREQEYGQHCLGKNFHSSAPLGPVVALKDEIPDPHGLTVELRVNGDVRQHANTRDLIYKVPAIVAHWSQAKLEVGDVITTGTPAGVAVWREPKGQWWLKPGDVIEAEVERIGVLRNRVTEPMQGGGK